MLKQWLIASVAIVLSTACIQPEAKGEDNSSSGVDDGDESVVEVEAGDPSSYARPVAAFGGFGDEMPTRQQLPDVIESVMPSVVGITTERTVQRRAPGSRSPFGQMFPELGPSPFDRSPRGAPEERQHRQENVGSGVIVDADGIVLTNNHVIDHADEVYISLADGREFSVEIAGTDPDSDLAVLRVEDPPNDLQPMSFGDSDELRLGETVVAIGNPFGLSGTVTMGIISAKGRADIGILDYENFIQTDAAINPGNSGGALINLRGELVGINTAIMSRTGGSQGVGFAIPSNMAKMVTTSLLEEGHVERGWLGVAIQELTPELREALELDDGLEGVVISDVQPGSPAAEYGLERGDVVTEIDGERVRSPQELRNTIGLRPPGDDVELRYVREDTPGEVTVTLGARDRATAAGHGGAPGSEVAIEGLELEPVDREIRRQYDIAESVEEGLVITGIERGSDAMRFDFREGDVILEVNRQSVTSIEEFNAVYQPERPRNLFLLHRDGMTIFLTQ